MSNKISAALKMGSLAAVPIFSTGCDIESFSNGILDSTSSTDLANCNSLPPTPPPPPSPPTVSYSVDSNYFKGESVSISPAVTGTILGYSISPSLPTGMNFDTLTGVISGAPTGYVVQTTYIVTATYDGGTIDYDIDIQIGEKIVVDSTLDTGDVSLGMGSVMTALETVPFGLLFKRPIKTMGSPSHKLIFQIILILLVAKY
ncbi:MAG: hypothetical protein R2827_06315 [Bdellovibrionales bacterium]